MKSGTNWTPMFCALGAALLLTTFAATEASAAAIELGAPFADNAILQRLVDQGGREAYR